jgi:hypothetical protein
LSDRDNVDPREALLWLQAALRRLSERLEEAGIYFHNGDQPTGVQRAIGATVEFLRDIPPLGEPHKLAPLRKILSGFEDLDNGIVPPLFKPKRRQPGRKETSDKRNLRACAAVAMELLCRKFDNHQASRFVAEELIRLNIKIGNSQNVTIKAAAKTVEQWRFNVHLNDDLRDTYKKLLDHEPSMPDSMSTDQWKADVLGKLRHVCLHMGIEADGRENSI